MKLTLLFVQFDEPQLSKRYLMKQKSEWKESKRGLEVRDCKETRFGHGKLVPRKKEYRKNSQLYFY